MYMETVTLILMVGGAFLLGLLSLPLTVIYLVASAKID